MTKIVKTELIERFIAEHNLSKTEFCKMCAIHPSTFKKIMRNETNYGIHALFKITRILNIDLHQIFHNSI